MRSNSILIYYKPSNSNVSRLGISASKKFGNAVKRNKLKRIVREYFRISTLKNSGFDILVVANNRFTKQKEPLSEKQIFFIREDLAKLFKKIV